MLGHPVKVNVLDVLRNVKLSDKRKDGITPISKAT